MLHKLRLLPRTSQQYCDGLQPLQLDPAYLAGWTLDGSDAVLLMHKIIFLMRGIPVVEVDGVKEEDWLVLTKHSDSSEIEGVAEADDKAGHHARPGQSQWDKLACELQSLRCKLRSAEAFNALQETGGCNLADVA